MSNHLIEFIKNTDDISSFNVTQNSPSEPEEME